MNFPLGQRFDLIARHALPAATTLVLLFAGAVVWPVPYFGTLTPAFGLMGVYYWAIHRPDLFRPLIVFLFGLLQDSLQGLPLGLSSFLFVVIYQIVLSQRRFFAGQIFFMLWFGFFLVMMFHVFAQWLLLWGLTGLRVPLGGPVVEGIFTVLVFPLPAYVLIRLQRTFLQVR